MCQVAINIPDEVLFDTKMSQKEANKCFWESYRMLMDEIDK